MKMKVELKRINRAFHFEAKSSDNLIVKIDGNLAIGGEGKGVRPMELLLMGLGGCASIDLGLILRKQRQELDDYHISISGQRKEDDSKAFKSIHLDFDLYGALDENKVKKAIELTLKKYCSVALSLSKDITITYNYKIN
jgi:putative redox protein